MNLDAVLEKIDEMITEWETKTGDDDQTMYTLGLRRLRDYLIGVDSLEDESDGNE